MQTEQADINRFAGAVECVFKAQSPSDCLMLMKSRKESIDLTRVEQHVKELAGYDISEKRIGGNLEDFLNIVRKEARYG